jgi:hypothetical protein
MRNNFIFFTNVNSVTMLTAFSTWVSTNKVDITSAVYYKDGVNHYYSVTFVYVV